MSKELNVYHHELRHNEYAELCLKSEADKVIADLEESHKKEVEQLLIEIADLKGRLASAEEDRDYFKNVRNERHEEEIAELKQKLENVQASMYADVVDANMEVRRLKRALYKACANWAYATIYYSGVHESDEYKWENMGTKCLKKAEEYK